MRFFVVLCVLMAFWHPAKASERLEESKFVAAVRLVSSEKVKAMDGQRYWVDALVTIKSVNGEEVFFCRPLGANAEIQVEFTCPQWKEEIRQKLKRNKSKYVRYQLAGNAHTIYEKEEIDADYEPVYYDKKGRNIVDMTPKEIEAMRLEDAREKGKTRKKQIIRLYAFTDAKKVVRGPAR